MPTLLLALCLAAPADASAPVPGCCCCCHRDKPAPEPDAGNDLIVREILSGVRDFLPARPGHEGARPGDVLTIRAPHAGAVRVRVDRVEMVDHQPWLRFTLQSVELPEHCR